MQLVCLYCKIIGKVNENVKSGVYMKKKIEQMRAKLYQAADQKVSYEQLLRISKKLDKCIVQYLRKNQATKGGFHERKRD